MHKMLHKMLYTPMFTHDINMHLGRWDHESTALCTGVKCTKCILNVSYDPIAQHTFGRGLGHYCHIHSAVCMIMCPGPH